MPAISIQKGLALQIRDDLRAAAMLATLGGDLIADSIQERSVPSLRDFISAPTTGHALPGILVVHPRTAETLEQQNNLEDAWGFPVLIAIAAASPAVDADNDRYLYWREQIIRRYITRGYTLTTPAATFHRVRVEPGPVSDWERWAKEGQFATWFILRFFVKLQRPQS